MPGDLPVVLTLGGGALAFALAIYTFLSKPISPATDTEDDPHQRGFDQDPGSPEDEARRRPF